MGEGGGCVPSKKKFPGGVTGDDTTQPQPPIETSKTSVDSSSTEQPNGPNPTSQRDVDLEHSSTPHNLKVFIVFYSMYGHVEGLAKRMKKGVDSVDGVEGVLYRVPETLSPEILAHMKASPKDDSIPEISSASELSGADGFLFGFPTRYGCMAAQMKAFFDTTGQLWKEQSLAGKPAGFFVSTGTQGGGQETTA